MRSPEPSCLLGAPHFKPGLRGVVREPVPPVFTPRSAISPSEPPAMHLHRTHSSWDCGGEF